MRILAILTLAALIPGGLLAGEKKLMHCFAFTVRDAVAPADFEAFQAATDALPSKVKAVSKVWHGKLRRPLAQFGAADADTQKAFATQSTGTGNFNKLLRQYGVCMEMASEAALTEYSKDPARQDWAAAYDKVRVPGTTTYDILGQ
jgi:hypothetical protein